MRFDVLLVLLFLLQTVTSGYYITDFALLGSSSSTSTFYLLEAAYTWVYSTASIYLLILSTKTITLNAIIFTIKFVIIIALFVFIRGGVPRYRYDFLTKIGWIKFLSLVLLVFLSSLLLVYLF